MRRKRGVATGQIKLSATVVVPVEQAFDYLADPGNASEVFRGMRELRQLSPGPLRQGSRLLAIRDAFEEEFTVTVYALADGPTAIAQRRSPAWARDPRR